MTESNAGQITSPGRGQSHKRLCRLLINKKNDNSNDKLLQYMQILYMIQLRNDTSWIKEHTEGISNTIADRIF